MGNRLTKIFTRKGDDGSTDTGSNERVPKYDIQIEVFGSLDELNASIGILTTEKELPVKIDAFLSEVQQNIFNLSGEIAAPKFSYIDGEHVLATLKQRLAVENLDVFSLSQSRPSLDDVYLQATGRTLMDAELAVAGQRDPKQERRQSMR